MICVVHCWGLGRPNQYYNKMCSHSSLESESPAKKANEIKNNVISLDDYRWKNYCGNLFQLPIAA